MSLGNMEQRTEGIRKQAGELIEQAYQRGFKAGRESNVEQYDKAWSEQAKDYIEIGRNEAWYAAQKLVSAGYKECNEILGDGVLEIESVDDVFVRCTASEAIEKIKAYEEKKLEEDDEIQVGDEVTYTFHNGRSITPFVVFKIECLEEGGKYYSGLETSTMKCVHGGLDYVKTGRHFPQIAEVLAKMKEGE